MADKNRWVAVNNQLLDITRFFQVKSRPKTQRMTQRQVTRTVSCWNSLLCSCSLNSGSEPQSDVLWTATTQHRKKECKYPNSSVTICNCCSRSRDVEQSPDFHTIVAVALRRACKSLAGIIEMASLEITTDLCFTSKYEPLHTYDNCNNQLVPCCAVRAPLWIVNGPIVGRLASPCSLSFTLFTAVMPISRTFICFRVPHYTACTQAFPIGSAQWDCAGRHAIVTSVHACMTPASGLQHRSTSMFARSRRQSMHVAALRRRQT